MGKTTRAMVTTSHEECALDYFLLKLLHICSLKNHNVAISPPSPRRHPGRDFQMSFYCFNVEQYSLKKDLKRSLFLQQLNNTEAFTVNLPVVQSISKSSRYETISRHGDSLSILKERVIFEYENKKRTF